MGDILLPILRDTKDPHYRYKMPKLTAKVEGSGNGIKTVITNMNAVAKSLGRPPSYPTKYFGCELGAQVTMNSEFIVNGSHDVEKLVNLLYGFIRKFVLCQKCNNPETTLSVNNQTIRQKCIACGYETTIQKTTHKLTTYIISHPPDNQGGSVNPVVSKSSKGQKSSKSEKKSRKNENGSGNGSPTNGHVLVDANDKNNEKNIEDNDNDDFDEDELTSDAYSSRIRALCDGLSTGMYIKDSKESANIFYNFVKEHKESNNLLDTNVQKELVKEAERLNIRDKSTLILSELLFTENIFDEIKTYKILLLRFCSENKKSQKYLLGGFEKLVGDVYKEKLFPNSLKILKQFYDQDILDEEVILEWASKESKKYVSKEMSRKIHEKVSPFIKWLKEAEVEEDDSEEENKQNSSNKNDSKSNQDLSKSQNQQQRRQSLEDDEEEDDEDGIDLVFSHRVSGINVESVKPNTQKDDSAIKTTKGSQKNETIDDIDIDNI